MKDFKKLIVWQKSMDVVVEVFKLIDEMEMNEKINIGSQLGRSAVSVPSNIAEGCGRRTDKEFNRFLDISMGSAFELETQLLIVQRTTTNWVDQIDDLVNRTQEIQKMVSGLKRSINDKSN
ncbi:MAG: four helix bundle protein [Flavobacteriales bacterium]|jgi:four helix bundle protein|nr:four helix bundle protein [Flavobacteriales bacterium]